MRRVLAAGFALIALAGVSGCTPDETADLPPETAAPPRPTGTLATPQAQHTAIDDARADPSPTPTFTVPSSDIRTPLPSGSAGTPRGTPTSLSPQQSADADAVAQAFMAALYTWDTSIDTSRNDSAKRAAVYASPTMAATLQSASGVSAPGQWWNELVKHKGYTTAVTELGGLGDRPADTATAAFRAVTVTAKAQNDKGWQGKNEGPDTYIVTLIRTSPTGPWTVERYEAAG